MYPTGALRTVLNDLDMEKYLEKLSKALTQSDKEQIKTWSRPTCLRILDRVYDPRLIPEV